MAVQKVIFELVVQDVGLTARIEQTRQLIRDLNKEIRQNPGPERFQELAAELSKNRRELTELTKQQKELTRELNALKVPKDSLAGLRLEYSKLSQAVANLSAEERKSDFGKNLIKNASNVKKEIDGVEQSIGRFTGNVGNYQSALNGLGQAFAAIGIGAGLNEIIGINTKIADSIADVAKTSGLATEEAQQLADALEFRDTRTSLADQLKIAEIGGQLGIATDQLEAFTAGVDTLNVALGDQFGSTEEVTRVTAGLRNVLTDFKTDNVSDDILRIGNALNFLEAQGVATAPTIAEFANRISGAAIPLGVTTEQVFGLSTALAELNINPERGATAISRVLQEVVKAPAAFAKAIGESEETFTQLVERDLVGAVALVAEKVAASADTNTEFAQTLDTLGIDSQGAIEAFGKLGGNLELLKTRTEQSRDALQSTDSITAEFEKKNNNAAAAVEKLQNAFVNLIASEGAQDAIEAVAKAATNLVEILRDTLEVVSDNAEEFALLSAVVFAFTGPGQKLAAVMAEINAITRVSTLGIAANTGATVAQTVATKAQTVATNILGAAQKALPLLALAAGIYLVVKAIDTYNGSLSAAEKATRAVSDAQEDIAESSAKEISALNASISVLQDSAASQKDRAAAIAELNNQYPEYLRGIDLEKASAAQLTVIQRELTSEIIKGAAARAKATAQAEITAQIVEKELKISELRRKEQSGDFSFQDRSFIIQNEENKVKKLREELVAVGRQFDETFKLNQTAQTEVITIVDPKSLKYQTDLAKLSISELEKLGTDAAKKEIERKRNKGKTITDEDKKAADKQREERQKALEQEAKAVETQLSRIRDIQRSIRDQQVENETGYDRQVRELENRREDALQKNADRLQSLRERIKQETGVDVTGGKTGAEVIRQVPNAKPATVTEADLIDQETTALQVAFDRQRNELELQRKRTADEQTAQLQNLLLELNQTAAENEVKAAVSVQEKIEASFSQRRESLKKDFEKRDFDLKTAFRRRDISEKEFNESSIRNQIEFTGRSLQLENEYATRVNEIATQVRDVKIAAAKTVLETQIQQIETRRVGDVQQAEAEGAVPGGPEISAKVSAINEQAAQDAIAANQQFTDAARQANDELVDAQLAGIDSVQAAKDAASNADTERIEQEIASREELIAKTVAAARQLADQIFSLQQQGIQRELDAKEEALTEEYDKKIKAATGNAQLQAKLEKELAQKQDALRKEAAVKQKKLALIQAYINTALAIVQALNNPFPLNIILPVLVAAAGAVQIAAIQSQPLAAGGFADDDNAQPGQSRTPEKRKSGRRQRNVITYPKPLIDSLPDFSGVGGYTGSGRSFRDDTGKNVAGKLAASNAVVHAGEYVAPDWQVQQDPHIFRAIEKARQMGRPVSDTVQVRPFAEGGFTGIKLPTFVKMNPFATGGFAPPAIGLPNATEMRQQTINVQAQATFTPEQVQQIGQIIATENAKVTRFALAEGLGDANRRLEREQSLEEQRSF